MKGDFEKLELNVETLRELTEDQLSLVAGGAVSGVPCNTSDYVPSGSAWTANCETIYRTTTLTDAVQTG